MDEKTAEELLHEIQEAIDKSEPTLPDTYLADHLRKQRASRHLRELFGDPTKFLELMQVLSAEIVRLKEKEARVDELEGKVAQLQAQLEGLLEQKD